MSAQGYVPEEERKRTPPPGAPSGGPAPDVQQPPRTVQSMLARRQALEAELENDEDEPEEKRGPPRETFDTHRARRGIPRVAPPLLPAPPVDESPFIPPARLPERQEQKQAPPSAPAAAPSVQSVLARRRELEAELENEDENEDEDEQKQALPAGETLAARRERYARRIPLVPPPLQTAAGDEEKLPQRPVSVSTASPASSPVLPSPPRAGAIALGAEEVKHDAYGNVIRPPGAQPVRPLVPEVPGTNMAGSNINAVAEQKSVMPKLAGGGEGTFMQQGLRTLAQVRDVQRQLAADPTADDAALVLEALLEVFTEELDRILGAYGLDSEKLAALSGSNVKPSVAVPVIEALTKIDGLLPLEQLRLVLDAYAGGDIAAVRGIFSASGLLDETEQKEPDEKKQEQEQKQEEPEAEEDEEEEEPEEEELELLREVKSAEAARQLVVQKVGVVVAERAAKKALLKKKVQGWFKSGAKLTIGAALSFIPIAGEIAGAAYGTGMALKTAHATHGHITKLQELRARMVAARASADDLALIDYAIAQKETKKGRALKGAVPKFGALHAAWLKAKGLGKKIKGTRGVKRMGNALDLVARAQLPGAAGQWGQAIIFELVDGDKAMYDAIRNAQPLDGAELVKKKLSST